MRPAHRRPRLEAAPALLACFASLALLVTLALLTSCRQNSGASPIGTQHWQAELMQADRDFAAAVAAAAPADRAAVWATWFARDGRQIVPGRVVIGTADITSLMAPAFADPVYSLAWEPDRAEVAGDGSLGYTSGRYSSRQNNATGDSTVSYGRYVTIWCRQADGAWIVALDTGVPDPAESTP